MSTRPDILAVIHARGGSKRIPLKNLAVVGDKPLIAYPILLAQSSKHITRTIVSTDHDGIMSEAKKWGAEIPFRRPADISEDVPSEMVTLHALNTLKTSESYSPTIVITLTPATPFTKTEDLDKGIQLLIDHPEWESVVTVRRASEFPEWMLRQEESSGLYRTVLGNPLNGKYNVSQNLEPVYYPAGAFYINRVDALHHNQDLYGKRFGAVTLTHKQLDIDTPEDLAQARAACLTRSTS